MPTGEFATEILGGLWPAVSTASWRETAHTQRNFASRLTDVAEYVNGAADRLLNENSGSWAEEMHKMYVHTRGLLNDVSDHFVKSADVT